MTEAIIPNAAQTTAIVAELRITPLKLLKMRMDETAGKTIIAEVSREPTRLIARTIITAHIMDIIVL